VKINCEKNVKVSKVIIAIIAIFFFKQLLSIAPKFISDVKHLLSREHFKLYLSTVHLQPKAFGFCARTVHR
jgi:uncharacterized membrane protein YqhA